MDAHLPFKPLNVSKWWKIAVSSDYKLLYIDVWFHLCFAFTATRAKMSMMNSMSRMRGQEKGPGYTQTEAILGESMQRFGRELGEESNFGELQHIKAPRRNKKKNTFYMLHENKVA